MQICLSLPSRTELLIRLLLVPAIIIAIFLFKPEQRQADTLKQPINPTLHSAQ